ncbi:DoxX family membrane protein [Flammeovirga sp. OC4]|uniref:DoxX family membrane protein n=1 Tax=Flammeovirga sp. OC4 TaxID=1382345 RepID=UPI0005C699A1|nr:DoxX family membrane protein [Flammeovirga sp. OC4]
MQSKIILSIRFVLGFFMAFIGLNKFFVFIEIPHPPGNGGQLMDIYMQSGFLQMVGTLELIGGIGFITNRFTLIAATIITAIMFNATVFHMLYDPQGVGPALICFLLSLVFVFTSKERPSDYLSHQV